MNKNIYLALAVVGTVVPYALLLPFVRSQGLDLRLLAQQATANPVAAMFTADLVISTVVFWIFIWREGGRLAMPRRWLYVVLSLLVGLSLALPLFLYGREGALVRRGTAGG